VFDVAIVGAGVAGSVAAIALAPTHSVVLIDKQAEPSQRIGECLPPAARRILHRLDLLEAFNQQPHLPSQGMQSHWGSEHAQIVDHIRNPDGFGWHLDRQKFELFLRESAHQRGVECIWPVRFASAQDTGEYWDIMTDATRQIQAKFLIDAGGRQSPFVRQQGMQREQVDKLIACWAILPDDTQSRMGVLSATKTGWWYSAPLPDHKRVIAFQTDSDQVNNEVKKDLHALIRLALTCPAMARLLANLDGTSKVHGGAHGGVSAASSTRLTQVAGHRWAALGDAALSFDPLSSQGMFNAMASAMQLVDLMQTGKDVSHEYKHQIENIWQHYLRHKNTFYRQENRWKNSPFWKRRHQ